MRKYELPSWRLSKVIVRQTDRQTDTAEIIYTTPLRGWSVMHDSLCTEFSKNVNAVSDYTHPTYRILFHRQKFNRVLGRSLLLVLRYATSSYQLS